MGWQDAPEVSTSKWMSAPEVNAPAQPSGGGTGALLAAVEGLSQGATLDFGDELNGVVGGALDKVLPESMGGTPAGKSFGDLYRENRDIARQINDRGRADQPVAFAGGNLVGGIASSALIPGGAATGQAATGGAFAKALGGGAFAKALAAASMAAGTGAAVGGASALGASKADLTNGEIDQAVRDTTRGAGEGAALGGGLSLAGSAMRPLAQTLQNASIGMGRRVLTNVGNSLSSRKGLSPEAVEEAFQQGAIRPFGTTQNANDVLERARDTVGLHYAGTIHDLQAAGVVGPHAGDLADQFAQEALAIERRTLGSPRAKMFRDIADELAMKPTDKFGHLDLEQAEDMKRELQHLARNEYDKLNATQTPRGEALQDVASRMREAIEQSVDAQRGLAPHLADQFQPIKEQLGNIIQASNAARAGANRASKNAVMGLPEIMAATAAIPAALSGHPAALALPLAMKIARTRGPATVASALRPIARTLAQLAPGAPPSGPGQMLLRALASRAAPVLAEQAGENAP